MIDHTHFWHELLLILSLVAIIGVFVHDPVQPFSLRKLGIVLIVTFFLLTHVNPGQLVLMSHHQTSSHTQQHPCCMPLLGEVTIIFLLFSLFLLLYENKKRAVTPYTTAVPYALYSRAPPIYLVYYPF